MPTLDPNHPEWKSFSEAMRAAPADDAARLVFADWVEEKMGGVAFARLIRSMCEVAKFDPTNKLGVMRWDERRFPGQSNWNHYADAERYLKSVWPEWEPLKKMHQDTRDMWRFHRGFPDKVVLDWRGLKYLDTLIAIGPVGEVEVVSGSPVTWEVFPNSIICSVASDPYFASRCKSPVFVLELPAGSSERESLERRIGGLHSGTTNHFLDEVWGDKVVRIWYSAKPNQKVWPTVPGAGVLLPWQDPLGMDRLNHSG